MLLQRSTSQQPAVSTSNKTISRKVCVNWQEHVYERENGIEKGREKEKEKDKRQERER